MCRRILLLAAVVLLPALVTSEVSARRYFVGGRGGLSTLAGGERPHFYARGVYGLEAGFDLTPRWTFEGSLTRYDLYTDSTIDNSFTLDGERGNATAKFSGTRIGALVTTELFSPASWLHVRGGAGGGLHIWKLLDPAADTTLEALGSRNQTLDFASSEVFVSGQLGLEVRFSPRVSASVSVQGDYLTGAGTDFAESISSDRARWLVGGIGALRIWFGSASAQEWRSQDSWSSSAPVRPEGSRGLDSDGDGVADAADRCADTPPGVMVDQFGCSLDSDGDGIVDGRDHCPGTDARARGLVDIYGCPVDTDFDGVPDYRDECPSSRIGGVVDGTGCPVDEDGDGVPNGLDDCPNSLYGVAVDKYGCLDLSIFDEPMVLNIDYPPGSFEIDPNSRERLRSLARLLLVAPEIRVEISGYTDNIGTEAANQGLSEKRARRVRDFLVAQGIEESRMRVEGRGESNFVATNETAEGRAMNRRIELVFHK